MTARSRPATAASAWFRAGELGDPEAVRTAVDLLSSRRIRHGIGPVRDRSLMREIAARGIVLDVCPVSNLRTRAGWPRWLSTRFLTWSPPGELLGSTDDPAMFGTDLTADYAAAAQLGVDPRACYLAGLRGALCDEPTRDMLRQTGDGFDWSAVAATPGGEPGNDPTAAGQPQLS
ncbi:MAG: hypothetical protein WBH47_05425 [Streptosporangiaceae bacterium]